MAAHNFWQARSAASAASTLAPASADG